jgi:uncharacterized protein (DUF2236 family)
VLLEDDDPLQRAADLGQQLALLPMRVPLRALGAIAEPRRAEIGRDVRRSLGITGEPEPPAMDPEQAFLDPHGIARQIQADLPSMLIGGLSALLLQTLHPLAMAGVAEHSNYAEDPTGRLQRTAMFVGRTTFGTVVEAQQAIAQVKRVHRRVHGISPDGRPYSANDPELVTWVHVAEVASFLRAADRFGPRRVSPTEGDAYFAEMAAVARELGAEWVPTSRAEVAAYFHRMRPELYAGEQAMDARDFLLRGVGTRPEDRAVYTLLAAAACSILPSWARSELQIPSPPLLDVLVVTPLARALCAGLRWAVTPAGMAAA